jgi:hypothetical protein
MRKHRVDSGRGNDKDCENDEMDSAPDHRQKPSREPIIGGSGTAAGYRPRSRSIAPD